MAGVLFGVTPLDAAAFSVSALLLFAVACRRVPASLLDVQRPPIQPRRFERNDVLEKSQPGGA